MSGTNGLSGTDQNEIDRRGLLKLGGLGVAAAAILAACGEEDGEIGRVGVADSKPELQEGTVDNQALLRTSASYQLSIMRAYEMMIDTGVLGESSPTFPDLGNQTELVTAFADYHREAATRINELVAEVDGEPFECGNPRLDQAYIDPIFARVFEGAPATDIAKEIPPSDDPLRDMINLVYSLEALSASTSQAMTSLLTEPALRTPITEVGIRTARQSALIALRINPGGYLPKTGGGDEGTTDTTIESTTTVQDIAQPGGTEPDEAAPPQTPIPLPVASPTTFGSVAAVVWIGGAGDENGVRMKVNFETPSLNSITYEFVTCDS